MQRVSPHDLLRSYSAAAVQRMARTRGIDSKGKTKEALVEILAPDLFRQERVQSLLPLLSLEERRVLDEVVLAGGSIRSESVRATLVEEGLVPNISPGDAWGRRLPGSERRAKPSFEDLMASLGAQGLVFSMPNAYGTMLELDTPGSRLFIPSPLLERLPGVTLPLETASEPTTRREAEAGAVLRDVYAMLSLARETPLPLTARGQITKRTLVQLDELFRIREGAAQARTEDDLARLSWLRALAQDAGLLEMQLGALALTASAEAFLRRAAGDRLHLLYDAYVRTVRWYELLHVDGLTVGFKGGGRTPPPQAVAARQRVLAELAELPVEQWVPVRHMVQRLRRRAYEFLLPRDISTTYGYWSSSGYASNVYRYGNVLGLVFEQVMDEAKGWELVEGGFIRTMLTKALYWLGAVDLGYGDAIQSERDSPEAFRLTAVGGALLRGQTPALPHAAPHVVIQPNFQVLVFPTTGEDVLFALDRLAERVRLEQVVEYRLTREAFVRAQRAGAETGVAISYLEKIAASPMPQNVRRTLEEWGGQLDRITIRRGVGALQVSEPAQLDALHADPSGGRLLDKRLTATLALVRLDKLESVRRGLLERGVVPALSEGADEMHPAQLSVTPEGEVRPRHRVPSMYVQRAVGAFTDAAGEPLSSDRSRKRTESAVRRLTPASLRRAARTGLTPEAVTATLSRWHVGPLPAEVVTVIRRWAKDLGRGVLVSVVLLRVRDAETLNGLLEDEEVGKSLRPLRGTPNVALVERSQARAVREALRARGMEIQEDEAALEAPGIP